MNIFYSFVKVICCGNFDEVKSTNSQFRSEPGKRKFDPDWNKSFLSRSADIKQPVNDKSEGRYNPWEITITHSLYINNNSSSSK